MFYKGSGFFFFFLGEHVLQEWLEVHKSHMFYKSSWKNTYHIKTFFGGNQNPNKADGLLDM